MNCKKAKELILIKSFSKDLNSHLSECAECYDFKQNYDAIINALNQDYEYPNLNLSESLLTKTQKIESIMPIKLIKPIKQHHFLAAAATFVILSFLAILYFYNDYNIKKVTSNNLKNNDAYQLCIKNTPDGILLTWKNSKKSQYTIYRSTNPKDFSNAKKIIIKGNKFLDKEANNYPIVFYKIL